MIKKLSVFFLSLLLCVIFVSCNAQKTAIEYPPDFEQIVPEEIGVGGLDIPVSEAPEQLRELFYSVYRVQKGDMISLLAEKFEVTQDTIISVNSITNSRLLQIGQYLRIPTMPGVVYSVRKDGETIQNIAQKYEVSAEKIATANKVSLEKPLNAGETLFVPDGLLDWTERQEINGDLFTRPLRRGYYISSYHGYRTNPFTRTRTYHSGIDMVVPHGTPVYAALTGTVEFAGWSNALGNHVIIAHHSGYRTVYGHLSRITTRQSAQVSTATKIGEVGNTGMSTGAHLHFSIMKYGRTLNPSGLW